MDAQLGSAPVKSAYWNIRDAQRQYNQLLALKKIPVPMPSIEDTLRSMSGINPDLCGPLKAEYGSEGNLRFMTSQEPYKFNKIKRSPKRIFTPNEIWEERPCKPGRVYHRKDPNPPTELCREDIDKAIKALGYDPEPDMYVKAFFGKLDIEERLEMYGQRVQLRSIDTRMPDKSGKTVTFRRYEPLCST